MISISAILTFKTILYLHGSLQLYVLDTLQKGYRLNLCSKLSIYTNNNNNRTYNIEICKVDKKRKDCQTETLIDLCKLKIGVVQQRVLTTKLGQSRDLATANYSRHIARKATYIHTTCILATKPSMLSITIQFRVLKEMLVNFSCLVV